MANVHIFEQVPNRNATVEADPDPMTPLDTALADLFNLDVRIDAGPDTDDDEEEPAMCSADCTDDGCTRPSTC